MRYKKSTLRKSSYDKNRPYKVVKGADGVRRRVTVAYSEEEILQRRAKKAEKTQEERNRYPAEYTDSEGIKHSMNPLLDGFYCMFHPPCGLMSTPEFKDNPVNMGPPMAPYALMQERLGIEELVRMYIQLDPESPSGLAYRRRLHGERGKAGAVQAGAPVLANTREVKGSVYMAGKIFGVLWYAKRVQHFLEHGEWPKKHVQLPTPEPA